jgi:hypothetical protein
MNTRATFSPAKAARAATATLLNRQKPMPRVAVAWCPGGRTSANPFATSPASTASVARTSPPAAISAASKERGET